MERLTNEEYWQMRSLLAEIRLAQRDKESMERIIAETSARISGADIKIKSLMNKKEELSSIISKRTGIDKQLESGIIKKYTIEIDGENEIGNIITE